MEGTNNTQNQVTLQNAMARGAIGDRTGAYTYAQQNFGTNNEKNNNIVTNTLTAATIGAGANAGFNILGQKYIISQKDAYIKASQELKKLDTTGIKSVLIEGKEYVKNSKAYKQLMDAIKIAESGKINKKLLGKWAAIGAALTGTLALIGSIAKKQRSIKLNYSL